MIFAMGFLLDHLRTLLKSPSHAPHIPISESYSPEEDSDLIEAVQRVREMQKAGYEMSFAFMPRYPDAPALHICIGHYNNDLWHASGCDLHSRGLALRKTLSEVIERSIWDEHVPYWKEGSQTA